LAPIKYPTGGVMAIHLHFACRDRHTKKEKVD